MRYQTFGEVSPERRDHEGLPPVMPLVGGMNGWKCVSWWKLTHHVRALGGQGPVLGIGAGARERDRVAGGVVVSAAAAC